MHIHQLGQWLYRLTIKQQAHLLNGINRKLKCVYEVIERKLGEISNSKTGTMILLKSTPLPPFARHFSNVFWLICITHLVVAQDNVKGQTSVFAKQNLVAWCIVPFDSMHRGPIDRARMLNGLGITKFAYDWRPEHIPTFDQELYALKQHNIKLQAFWHWSGYADPSKIKNWQLYLICLNAIK
jgi:hypothetical protein